MATKKLADAYVELRADDSKLLPDVKAKATRAGKEFGGQLNKSLKQMKIDPIDIKASPKEALAAIKVTEARLKELSRNAETVEVKIRTERSLAQLAQFRKKLGEVGDDSAGTFASRFGARLGPLLASTPISPPLAIAAGAAGAVVAPLLGGAIAGGVIGGAGIGGVIGGLKLAAQDARVAAEAENIGKRIQGRLFRAGGAFVQPALIGMREIEAATKRVDIERIFRSSARYVPILTTGVTSAIGSLGEGFESLTRRAESVVKALSRTVDSVSRTLGGSMKLLSTDADAGASSIDDLTQAINYFITTTVGMVHGLAQIKDGLDGLDDGIDSARRGVEDFFTKMAGGRAEFDITADNMTVAEARAKALADRNKELADKQRAAALATRTAGDSIKKAAEVTEEAKASQQKLTESLSAGSQASIAHSRAVLGEVGAMKDLNNALRAQIDPLFGVINSQNNLKTAQDKAAASIRKHGRSSAEAKEATRNLAEAALDLQGKTANLAQGFDGKLTPSMRATFKAAGLTKNQVRDVETQLKAAKRAADKFDGRYMANTGITGDKTVLNRLLNLAAYQNALRQGSSNIASIRKKLSKDNADFLKFDAGGYTGPGSKYEPAGIVHRDEFVIRKEARRRIEQRVPGLLDEMNATGQIPGYDRGGSVRWPYPVTAAKTRVPSLAEVMSKVAVAFGSGWPASPSAQRGDSGIWRRIVALIRSTGPMSGSFGNGYRPGDPKWHGSGRAVDWMGFNQDRLARFLAARRPLELIHRTRTRDYAYTRGVNKGSFNQALMNAHRNHIHIAYDKGGRARDVQPVKVMSADTGRATLEQGWNLIQNSTGKQEHMAVGMEEAVGVLNAMLSVLMRLAPAMGEEVGRRLGGGGGRADAALGSRADLMARYA